MPPFPPRLPQELLAKVVKADMGKSDNKRKAMMSVEASFVPRPRPSNSADNMEEASTTPKVAELVFKTIKYRSTTKPPRVETKRALQHYLMMSY